MPQKPPFEIHPGNFSLDVSGVAGFFGGEEAISAMQTIHLYKGRKFLGWYNSPGSWNVGKKFGMLANSRFWDGLFPGPNEEPAKFFQLDGKQGPKYVASRSGSILEHTGHLAYLIMQTSKEELGVQVEGRVSKPNKVTIIQTQPVFKTVADSAVIEELPVREIPSQSGLHTYVADWFCFSMILLGIVSSGISSVVIGSACLRLQGVKPAPTAPPGDGMLMDGDDIVLLLGKEENVATITRGRFILEYAPWARWRSRNERRKRSILGDGIESTNSDHRSDAEAGLQDSSLDCDAKQGAVPTRDEYAAIGLCSLLLVIQLLGQLLLIPQGTFFGQIMFLCSFAASWVYNLYLSAIDKEYIQEQLLLKVLNLDEQHMQTYILGTRTAAAVFACLMLQPHGVAADKWKELGFKPESIIHNFIPNDTPVWVTWRKKMVRDEDVKGFNEDDKELLEKLLKDARIAYDLATKKQWLAGGMEK